MFLKKMFSFFLVFATVGVMAQKNDRVYHHLIFEIGSVDLEENSARFAEVFAEFGVEPGSLIFDLSGDAFHISETTHFRKHFALEGSVFYFDKSYVVEQDGLTRLEGRHYGFTLFSMGKWPLFKGIVAYGKGGATYGRAEYRIEGNTVRSGLDKNQGALAWGAGAYWEWQKRLVVKLDYTTTAVTDLDADSTTLGLGFRF